MILAKVEADAVQPNKDSSSVRSDVITLAWTSALVGLVLIGVIIVSGQYRNTSFWLSTATVTGLAYFITRIPDRMRFLRYPAVAVGLFLPRGLDWLLKSPPETTPDISAATIIFVMALFWLPVVCRSRPDSPCA
jgi:hypothetical protein